MYKVLVFGMTTNPGGIESFLMSYYRKINKQKIQFDFLCNTHEKIAYEQEIKSMGGKVFKVSMRSKHPIRYRKELETFFKNNAQNYDCIWVNVNSLANIDYLKLAKKYGIKRRIIHSHNSQNMDNKLRGILHAFNRININRYATDFWACSISAAKWFYNKDLMPKVRIIPNAIDLDRVKYNEIKRKKIREKYNLEKSYVIGNIGRLHFQKNQSFAIDILNNVIKSIPNAHLIFIGDGPDKSVLSNKVRKLKLQNKVSFMGLQDDISSWLSAFDLFLFPSRFEGLPIAGLEAQGNGVPVLATQNVFEKDAIINPNIQEMSLNKDPKEWAASILSIANNNVRLPYEKVISNFKNSDYEINNEVKVLENYFLNNVK